MDPEAASVRKALRSLKQKNVVEVVYRTVPAFRLATERETIDVQASADESSADDQSGADETRETSQVTENRGDRGQTDKSAKHADILKDLNSDLDDL